MTLLILAAVALLAWSNGSNDNFKGVATIYGSGTASYRAALAWATLTQLAGSLCAVVLAAGLIKTFSAKGLVPDAIAASPAFLGAAALGAGVTVLLATWLGLPISTTHALTGALVGAGLASGAGVHFAVLGKSFVLPLLLSPVVAVAIAAALYPLARAGRKALGVERESCICVGEEWVPIASPAGAAAIAARMTISAERQGCADRYQGRVVGISAQRGLDVLHFASAGAVSFARALNDTPKIAGILLGAHALGATVGLPVIGGAMAIGGLLGARRVAETMAHKIAPLNAGQGFVANLTTAALVLCASRFALPVSTTHVATGGIFGIGAITGTARRKTVVTILTAWVTTLPLGALVGAVAYLALRR